jgi:RHS repeat-associated protein
MLMLPAQWVRGQQAAVPQFNPGSAEAAVPFSVGISSATPASTIRYTLDGTIPHAGSPAVSGGKVQIVNSSTLKARAFAAGYTESNVASSSYTLTGMVAGGAYHGIALSKNGTVLAWGEQISGKVGNGLLTPASVVTPVHVLKAAGVPFTNAWQVSASYEHSLVIDASADRYAWAFGANSGGQLGDNTTAASAYARRVLKTAIPYGSATASDFLRDIASGAAGDGFSLAAEYIPGVNPSGFVWAWGRSSFGRLGDGTTSSTPTAQTYARKVLALPGLTLSGVASVVAGNAFGMALAPVPGDSWGRGQVWAWGQGIFGQLAQGNLNTSGYAVPAQVSAGVSLNDAVEIAAGSIHGIALRDNGSGSATARTVWCWGAQAYGRLGNGQTAAASQFYPVAVQKSSSAGGGNLTGILHVAAANSHSVALGADGRVWTWGANGSGQLGDGTTNNRGFADTVKTSSGQDLTGIVAIGAGGEMYGTPTGFTLAVKADGTVYGWGYNVHGETGFGTPSPYLYYATPGVLNVAPRVTLSAPILILPAPLVLTATPLTQGASITKVDFFQNGALLGSVTSAPWTWTPATPIVAPGLYPFSAQVTDSTGAVSALATFNVTAVAPYSSSYAVTGGLALTGNAAHYAASASTQIPLSPANDQLGVLAAPLSVSPEGSANISVPLQLPKGTAGVEPDLSLSYDSSAGDGYAGVGWTVTGLSTITRGGNDQAHEARSRGISFSREDSFYFNGERLIRMDTLPPVTVNLVPNQLPNGADFRTEINQLSRIRFLRLASGEGYWRVWTKAGLIITFGDTVDTRVMPENQGSKTLTWYVRRVQDRRGNYFDYDYERQPNSLSVLPKTVKYTGNLNTGLLPYITVTFLYQTRNDVTSGYRFGTGFVSDKLLERITVQTDGFINRTYKLNYTYQITSAGQTTATSRAHVTSIQEHAGDLTAASTLPTTFAWTAGARAWNPASTATYNLPRLFDGPGLAVASNNPHRGRFGDQGRQFVDLNGDGLTDIVWRHVFCRDTARDATQQEWENLDSGVMINTGNGYTTPSSALTTVTHPYVSNPAYIVWDTALYPLTPATDPANPWLPPAIMSANDGVNTGAHFVDLNGDGLQDIISRGSFSFTQKGDWTGGVSNWNYDPNTYFDGVTGGPLRHVTNVTGAWVNTGAGWESTPRYASPVDMAQQSVAGTGVRLIDLNGDGLMDLLQALRFSGQATSDPVRSRVWMNAGPPESGEVNPNAPSKAWVASTEPLSSARRQALALLAASYENFGKSGTTNPDEFIMDTSTPTLARGREFFDVNGDGLLDFVVARHEPNNTFTYKTWLNSGNGWTQAYDSTKAAPGNVEWKIPFALFTNVAPINNEWGASLVDVNGDGLLDCVQSANHFTNHTWECNRVYLNTGKGWPAAPSPGWVIPGYLAGINSGGVIPMQGTFADVNGDSLADFVSALPGISTVTGRPWAGIWLNTGSGWGTPVGGTYNGVAYTATSNIGTAGAPILIPRATAIPTQSEWILPAGFVTAAYADAGDYHFIDINDDGFVDLIKKPNTASYAIWLNGAQPEAIHTVTSGLGARSGVDYKRMNDPSPDSFTGNRVYNWIAKPSLPTADQPAYPIVESVGPGRVVARHWSESGFYTMSGSENVMGALYTVHRYGKSRSHVTGYGDLGMGMTEEFDYSDGSRETTLYRQDFPFQGLAHHSEICLCLDVSGNPNPVSTAVLAKRTTTTYAELPCPPGKSWRFPYAASSKADDYDLDATVETILKTTETITTYPASTSSLETNFNLSTQVTLLKNGTGSLVSKKSLSNFYYGDNFGAWTLGLLATSQVIHESFQPGIDGSPAPPPSTKLSQWGYTNLGQIDWECTEPNGSWQRTTYTYDNFGNTLTATVTALNEASAPSTTETYDPRGRFSVASANALGHTTTRTYDTQRAVVTDVTDPNGFVTHTDYDAFGTALRTTSYYGMASALSSVQFSKSFSPGANNPLPTARYYTVSQTQGSVPTITYFDKFNRTLLTETVGFGGQPLFSSVLYDSRARSIMKSRSYFSGEPLVWESVEYDRLGRARKTNAPDGTYSISAANGLNITSAAFSATGTLLTARQTLSDLEGRTVAAWEFQTGVAGAPAAVANLAALAAPISLTAPPAWWKRAGRFAFYADGSPWKVISPTGRQTITSYVPRSATTAVYGVTTTVTDNDTGTSVHSTYDGFGRVHSVTQTGSGGPASGEVITTSFTYDLLSRVLTKTAPEGVWTNVYDTSPRVGATGWKGMLFTKSSPGGYHERHEYDTYGRSVYTRVNVASDDTHNYESTATYDALGRPYTSTDAGGFTTRQVYNAYGFASAVLNHADGTLLMETLTVDSQGRILTSRQGNGVHATDTYDNLNGNLMNTTVRRTASGPVIDSSSYQYNAFGNKTQRSRALLSGLGAAENQAAAVEDFAYDGLQRLTSQTVVGKAAATNTYDASGNITYRSGVGSYTYGDGDEPDRVTFITRTSGSVQTIVYDGFGRVTSDSIPNGRYREMGYTSFGQLSYVECSNQIAPGSLAATGASPLISASYTFDFDADGNRIRQGKYVSSVPYIAGNHWATSTTTVGSYEMRVTRRNNYYYTEIREDHAFPGGVFRITRNSPTTAGVADVTALNAPVTKMAYHIDGGQGSTEGVTDASATVTERSSYDAWGRRRDVSDWDGYQDSAGYAYSSPEKPGYTGHEDLDCAGLIHMNGRIYDAEWGRFLQMDPILQDPGSSQNFNRYAYVMNNPLNLTDPSGYSWLSDRFKSVGRFFGKVIKGLQQVRRGILNSHRRIDRWIKRNYRVVITVAVAVVVIVVTYGAATAAVSAGASAVTLGEAVAIGAVSGAGISASTTAIMGGSWRDIGRAAFRGAVTGAISAGVAGSLLHGIETAASLARAGGEALSGVALDIAHGLAHGLTGGAMSAAQGGSFADGFIGSAAGAFLTP